MRFNLPQNIKFVLNTFNQNGHKAYIVGGCVRDLLCQKKPHDFDVTTSALPHETQNLFDKTIATGLSHGTVTIMIDGEPIEATTFRTESVYNDSRHPESVNFVRDVKDDLARRDFTVNAMCYNETDGLIDLFGGADDINHKILRAVGNAEQRFSEDALRILRLFRFAATLKFTIEKDTFSSAIKCAPLLKNISAERIFTELKKAACGDNISVLSPLLETRALENFSLVKSEIKYIEKLPKSEDLRAFALLFLASDNLKNTLDSLKCSNAFKDYCLKLSHLVSSGISCNKIALKQALNIADFPTVLDALEYLNCVMNTDISNHKKLLDEIKNSDEPYKISHLDITGNDIAKLGFRGEQIGQKLAFLLDEVLKNPDLNTKEKLLNLICN